jgi:hypothetical protein
VNDPAPSKVSRLPAAPPTVAQLAMQVEDRERAFADAQRSRNAARVQMPTLIADGDKDAVAAGRLRIQQLDLQTNAIQEELVQLQEALGVARDRERAAGAEQLLSETERLVNQVVREANACEEGLDAYTSHYLKLQAAQAALDRKFTAMNLAIDPYLLRAKVDGILAMRLWMKSDGVLGEQKTLDTKSQLERNGRASLKLAARDFAQLILRRVRIFLSLADDTPPPPQAA